jgi:hypothetical protein
VNVTNRGRGARFEQAEIVHRLSDTVGHCGTTRGTRSEAGRLAMPSGGWLSSLEAMKGLM